jgi:hypothetical protein
MGHAKMNNQTPYSCDTLFLSDEEGRPLLVPVVRATYTLLEDWTPVLAPKQLPVNPAGQFWGAPEESSYKYEPETAFAKPSTDVVLIGSAYPSGAGDSEVTVRLSVGALQKTLRVVGDRYWVRSLGTTYMTPPEPFEKMPLIWERAFGGWDRSHPEPGSHTFEPRNPVGTGFRSKKGNFEEGIHLPNLEDPASPIRRYHDTPPPAGVGFTSPGWQPRSSLAGTYDETWINLRRPLLPADFDRRFFNSAAPGLVATSFLTGHEPVQIDGVSSGGMVRFRLPGAAAPECAVQLTGRVTRSIQTRLDTVVINTDERLVVLTWRGDTQLRTGPHDLLSIEVRNDAVTKIEAN